MPILEELNQKLKEAMKSGNDRERSVIRMVKSKIGERENAKGFEGEITDDPIDTFGGYGVARIADLQGLLRFICENGFEHHVALNRSTVAEGVYEALAKYLSWDIYYHEG